MGVLLWGFVNFGAWTELELACMLAVRFWIIAGVPDPSTSRRD